MQQTADVTLPETLETIGARSFGGCDCRIVINIPEITEYFFWSCANVTSVDLWAKGDLDRTQRLHYGKQSAGRTVRKRSFLASGAFGSAGSKSRRKENPLRAGCIVRRIRNGGLDGRNLAGICAAGHQRSATDGRHLLSCFARGRLGSDPARDIHRTVCEHRRRRCSLTASQFSRHVTKISAQSAPVPPDLNMAKFEATEFPTGLAITPNWARSNSSRIWHRSQPEPSKAVRP